MGELDEQGQQELEALGRDAGEEEVNAMYRRGQARFAQKRWPQRGAPRGGAGGPTPRDAAVRAPARPEGEITCPNCPEKGHDKDACKKLKISMGERTCFLRRKTCHMAFQCPEGSPGPVNNVDGAQRGKAEKATSCSEGT